MLILMLTWRDLVTVTHKLLQAKRDNFQQQLGKLLSFFKYMVPMGGSGFGSVTLGGGRGAGPNSQVQFQSSIGYFH